MHQKTEPLIYVTCIKKFGEDRTYSSGDTLADRQTEKRSSQYFACPTGGKVASVDVLLQYVYNNVTLRSCD